MIEPEPDNQFDSKAIAFKCRKWQRIGYIVRKALDEVHTALTQEKSQLFKDQLSSSINQKAAACLCPK